MSNIIKYPHDRNEYEEFVEEAGEKLIILIFTTSRNMDCNGIIKKLEFESKTKLRRYKNKVVYIEVNTDKINDVDYDFDVNLVPSFVFMKKDKKVLQQWEGEGAYKELSNKLDEHFKK